MRRAMRHLYHLGTKDAAMHRLVPMQASVRW
jgi:alanyl-tRNA synthetase